MQFKQLQQHLLTFTHWLIATSVVLAFYFAWMTYQQANHTAQQALTTQAMQLSQRVSKALALSDQRLHAIATQLDAAIESTSAMVASPYLTNVTVQYDDGTQLALHGPVIANPTMTHAITSHLATGRSAMLTLADPTNGVRLLLVQRLQSKPGLLIAELNQAQWLSALGNGNQVQLQQLNGHLVVWQNAYPLKATQLKPLFDSSARYQQGLITLDTPYGKLYNAYRSMSMTQDYASPDWMIVSSQTPPALVSMLMNTSATSIGIFACLVVAFSLFSLRNKLQMNIRRHRLEANTVQFQQKFVAHLSSMSAMDKAILAGVKFDEITEISLRQILSTLPSQLAGVVKLPASNKAPAELYLMTASHEKKIVEQKLDKWVQRTLEEHHNGYVLEDVQASPFFKTLLEEATHHVLLLPIFKEGTVASFLFATFHPKHKLTEFELGCCRNISQHLGVALTAIAQSEKLYVKEYFDPVTGLFNQSACRERLSQEMSRARRKKEKLAVFQLNLIGYKKINETFGYLMGDQLLKEVGARLKSNLRDTDILARFGSDDFVIITSDIDKVTHANRLADKLTKLFSKPFAIFDHSFNIAAAIGISVFPQDGITVDEILNHANFAMNKAKKVGPNQYAFYEDNLSTNEAWRISLEKDLRLALLHDQLFLKYQAQVNPRSKKICGVEALIRWDHPERGLVSPMEFITLSEETGLIVAIGQYARKMAFNQFMEWKQGGVDVSTISVNVSSYEMQRHEFMPELLALIQETAIDPRCVELEITESLMLELSGNVMQNLTALHALGIRIAIDDFGTGYSNLSYLGRLPFDVLKIDKSFMHGIGLQSSSNQVVNMMIDMAHHLGKTVCAEGVENDIQYQFLEHAGCDILQGYYLSKPLGPSEFVEFFHTKPALRVTSHA